MDQSFTMEPATVTDSKQHVPPCEVEELTKEQQAVVEGYRKQQAVVDRYPEQRGAKRKSVPVAKQTRPKLVYSAARLRNGILQSQLTNVNAPGASFDALTSSSFPSWADFSAAATADALKWADLEQNVVYQIVSTRTVNIQHGQSVILSLQKADGSSCSAWSCGMLTKELLQNPMLMVTHGYLFDL